MDAQVREKLARADRGEPEPERRSDESLLKCEQPEIGFRSFVSVYNQIMGAKVRQHVIIAGKWSCPLGNCPKPQCMQNFRSSQ
eukprot:SAG11_NODE_103_length_16571_cov_49.569208_11_plen_83_part_00